MFVGGSKKKKFYSPYSNFLTDIQLCHDNKMDDRSQLRSNNIFWQFIFRLVVNHTLLKFLEKALIIIWFNWIGIINFDWLSYLSTSWQLA